MYFTSKYLCWHIIWGVLIFLQMKPVTNTEHQPDIDHSLVSYNGMYMLKSVVDDLLGPEKAYDILLEQGTLFVLSGDARWRWLHR